MPPSDLDDPTGRVETQATISAWAESTFGPSGSNARAIARANREMAELLEHVTADDRHPEAAEEIADIVIVLSRVMTRLGVDLQAAIDRKMTKNRARKWKLDGTGHGYHVKDDAETGKSCRGCGNVGTHAEGGREYCATCGQEVL
jgi:MazG-like family